MRNKKKNKTIVNTIFGLKSDKQLELWTRTVAKNYLLYRSSKSNFADKECFIISAVFKL